MEIVTLEELIAYTRQRSDMEHSLFVSDAEITHWLNDEIQKLYSEMINIDDGELFATVSPTLTQIGPNTYQLPSDFLRLVDVNIFTRSRWVPAYEGDPQNYLPLLTRTYQGRYDVQYYLRLDPSAGRYTLTLFPEQDVGNIGVRYIPEHPLLSLPSDTLKWPSSWHRVPALGAAIKALVKEESDPTGLMIEYDKAIAQVLKDVREQKIAEIETLRQVAGRNRRRRRHLPWI